MIDNNNGLLYSRNQKELVWYQEHIYQDGALIGEIFTNIEDGGFNLRKLTQMGEHLIMQTIAPSTQFVMQKTSLIKQVDYNGVG